jgi:hypothetical protein
MPDAAIQARPEVELKYLLPRTHDMFVLRWLEGVAEPERAWPPALVVTTYFDSAALDLLDEKVNSDYLKTKVRVRWYAPLDGGPPTGPAFVEMKSREGATRGKHRAIAEADAADLDSEPMSTPIWSRLVSDVRRAIPALPPDLAPVMRLAYARHRFLDGTGARISVDTGILVKEVNPGRLHATARPDALPWAVFEYKGQRLDLPAHLGAVARFGARRSAFSKYLACYEHVTRQTF